MFPISAWSETLHSSWLGCLLCDNIYFYSEIIFLPVAPHFIAVFGVRMQFTTLTAIIYLSIEESSMFSATTTAAFGPIPTTISATTLPSPFPSATTVSAVSEYLGADHESQDDYSPFANLESLAAWALYHSNFVNRKRLPQLLFQQMHGLPQWLKLNKRTFS